MMTMMMTEICLRGAKWVNSFFPHIFWWKYSKICPSLHKERKVAFYFRLKYNCKVFVLCCLTQVTWSLVSRKDHLRVINSGLSIIIYHLLRPETSTILTPLTAQRFKIATLTELKMKRSSLKMNNQFLHLLYLLRYWSMPLLWLKKKICAERHNFNILYLKRRTQNHISNSVTLTSPVISDVQSNKQPNELFRFCRRGAFFFFFFKETGE